MSEAVTPAVAAEAAPAAVAAAASEAAVAPTEPSSLLSASAAEDTADTAAEAPKAPEALVVPEDYTLDFGEGATVDEAALGEYKGALKEAGLTQEQAAKLTPWLTAKQNELRAEAQKSWTDLQTSWVTEVKADPDIGGTKLSASMSSAAKAIDKFGGASLRQALALTGAGNNPAIVKAFVQIGRALGAETKLPAGTPPSAARDNSLNGIAARLYGQR